MANLEYMESRGIHGKSRVHGAGVFMANLEYMEQGYSWQI